MIRGHFRANNNILMRKISWFPLLFCDLFNCLQCIVLFFGAGVVIRIKYAFVEYIILVYSLLINVGHYEFSTVARA